MWKKRITMVIIALFLCVTVIVTIRCVGSVSINFQSINKTVQKGGLSQGNYVLLCEENRLSDFPFVVGGRLRILSIPDGKKYFLGYNSKTFLGGFADPMIQGDRIYWFGADMDGENAGDFHVMNIKKNQQRYQVPEDMQATAYLVCGETLYYASASQVIQKSLTTGAEHPILERKVDFLAEKNQILYCYDREKRRIICKNLLNGSETSINLHLEKNETVLALEFYKDQSLFIQTAKHGIKKYSFSNGKMENIAENGSIWDGNNTGINTGTQTIHIKGNSLFYYDACSNVYERNLVTKKQQKIIDWNSVKFVQPYIKEIKEAAMLISWCDDYIVVQSGYYDYENDNWIAGIMAFDYDGKQKYEEKNTRLML